MVKKSKSKQETFSQEKMETDLLNQEYIAARRISLEDAELVFGKSGDFKCNYCSRKFSSETVFMKHVCEPKRRAEELLTNIGQAAYQFYCEWMRRRKFGKQSVMAFMASKFYRSFINFAELVAKANISDTSQYIKLMVENEMPPALWCRDQSYALYLNWMDQVADPIQQVQASIEYLIDICEKEGVKLQTIFEHLGSQKILSLIRQRRLSPWFLFSSEKFIGMLRKLTPDERGVFSAVINAAVWSEKFQAQASKVKTISEIVKGLDL